MSEYQYYEFCKISTPMSKATRELMYSLSSRANVGTHNALVVGSSPTGPINYINVLFTVLKHLTKPTHGF